MLKNRVNSFTPSNLDWPNYTVPVGSWPIKDAVGTSLWCYSAAVSLCGCQESMGLLGTLSLCSSAPGGRKATHGQLRHCPCFLLLCVQNLNPIQLIRSDATYSSLRCSPTKGYLNNKGVLWAVDFSRPHGSSLPWLQYAAIREVRPSSWRSEFWWILCDMAGADPSSLRYTASKCPRSHQRASGSEPYPTSSSPLAEKTHPSTQSTAVSNSQFQAR